jgi:hypothetical protein
VLFRLKKKKDFLTTKRLSDTRQGSLDQNPTLFCE